MAGKSCFREGAKNAKEKFESNKKGGFGKKGGFDKKKSGGFKGARDNFMDKGNPFAKSQKKAE